MGGGIVIFTALRYEGAALARALGLKFGRDGVARSAGDAVRLYVVGPRGARLPGEEAVRGCRAIVMAGLGGGLDPALQIGDVVVDELSDWDVGEGPWRKGKICCAAEIVSTARQKSELHAVTGGLVVDMEGELARRFAARCGVPYLGIRAVGDRADEVLEPTLGRWPDAGGSLLPRQVIGDLCRRPGLVLHAWRLGSRSRRAMRKLGQALIQVVETAAAGEQSTPVRCGS